MKPPLKLFDGLSEWGTLSPGLERVESVLNALNQPFKSYPHILIGGTNGKGTVCANIAHHLPGKIGLFLSPHVVDIRERITIAGEWVPDEDWQWAYSKVVETLGLPDDELSYFEWLLVLACLIFQKHQVDMAVFEVGVGGTLDATNVLDPILSAVTNVGLDHQALLGNTREAIAVQKMGIGRSGKPFLIPSDVLDYRDVRHFLTENELTPQVFENKGVFQDNFQLVSRILETLGHRDIKFQPVHLPGRRNFINIGQGVIIDGAHNMPAWEDLLKYYKDNFQDKRAHVIGTLSQGRNTEDFIKLFSNVSSQVFKFNAGYERELTREQWPKNIKDVRSINIQKLLERPLLVCGSLYMVEPFKQWMRSWPSQ